MAPFQTTDFYLACYLKAIGYRLMDVQREGQRSVFEFEDRPERRDTLMGYYNNEGTVRPLALVGAIKDMKALIHNI